MSYVFSASILKFGVAGMIGMSIDFFSTWLLKEKLTANKYLANSMGFTFAVLNNFLINRYWTFHNNTQSFTPLLSKFFVVSLIGLGINNALLYLLVNKAKNNFYLLKLFVTGVVFFWNFFANSFFTFN